MARSRALAALVPFLAIVPAGAASARPPGFQTPSGRIHCAVLAFPGAARELRCDALFLNDRAFTLTARGPGRAVHITDTVADPAAPKLAYGRTFRSGAFRCTSRRVGLTCRSVRSAHGFFVSRERQRTF